MHIRTVIEQLGYSPHEVDVYLASLQLGGSTITEIAGKAKLPRTTAGEIIEALRRKGLMNAYLNRRRRVWVAENPEKLIISLKEREAALKMILPQLQSLRHDTGVKPTVRTYVGVQEIRQIMNDILETRHNFFAILSWDEWIKLLGKAFTDDFIETRRRHFLKVKVLMPRTATAFRLKQKDSQELRTTRFLPGFAQIKNSNFIYGNKVAIISLNERRPTGIVIEDQDIVNTMEIFFESLWQQSGDD